ncbi:MAG: hypothetical protein ACFFEF_00435 [Candidatus Thorarchaeota archaeon]
MLYERISDAPILTSKDYSKIYQQPLIASEKNEWVWKEFYGTGISIDEHPLSKTCNIHGCGSCRSANVSVIYAKWCVSTASGDAYWDYEVVCNDCGKFTARSFSEND